MCCTTDEIGRISHSKVCTPRKKVLIQYLLLYTLEYSVIAKLDHVSLCTIITWHFHERCYSTVVREIGHYDMYHISVVNLMCYRYQYHQGTLMLNDMSISLKVWRSHATERKTVSTPQ